MLASLSVYSTPMIGCFMPKSRMRFSANPVSGVNIQRAITSGLAARTLAICVSMLVAPCATASLATILPPPSRQTWSASFTMLSPTSFCHCICASFLAPISRAWAMATRLKSVASERLLKR
jgi:hypothetical protein